MTTEGGRDGGRKRREGEEEERQAAFFIAQIRRYPYQGHADRVCTLDLLLLGTNHLK